MLKKIVAAMLLLLLLCGCEKKFAADACIGGVPVGGLTQEEALSVLEDTARNYTLRVELEGSETLLTGQQLGLTFRGGKVGQPANEVFGADRNTDILPLLSGIRPGQAPVPGTLTFDGTVFSAITGTDGWEWDYTDAVAAVFDAAENLQSSVTVTPVKRVLPALSPEEDSVTTQALTVANAMLNRHIRLVRDTGETLETLTSARIAPWLSVSADGYGVDIDGAAVLAFAEDFALANCPDITPGLKFLTTDGREIVLEEPRGKGWIEPEILKDRIIGAIRGTEAEEVLLPVRGEGYGPMEVEDFGGTYVEVDIPNQTVYLYEDGELILTTPCVTGCVANGDDTPTGVYHFYNMDRDAWLEGPTWLDWVDCWMAFYGGYGMHDASWRDEFGGDIYLENGSHGCVNLPPEAAPMIYKVIDIGDAIILY